MSDKSSQNTDGKKVNLHDDFDKSRGDALMIAPCTVKGTNIAMGKVTKFLDAYEEPQRGPEFGVGLEVLSELSPDAQETLKAKFVEEQTQRIQKAHEHVTEMYRRHLWIQAQSLEDSVAKHGGTVEFKNSDAPLEDRFSSAKITGIDDKKTLSLLEKRQYNIQSTAAAATVLAQNGAKKNILNHVAFGRRAEVAVNNGYNELIERFQAMDSPEIQKFMHDLEDFKRETVRGLEGRASMKMSSIPDGAVVLADKIPSLMAVHELKDPDTDEGRVAALLIRGKSLTAHALFVAQSYGITVGLIDQETFDRANDRDMCIVSGLDDLVLIEPNQTALDNFKGLMEAQSDAQAIMNRQSKQHKSPKTLDGAKVNVRCNYEDVNENIMRTANPVGFGLVRSENLFNDDGDVADLSDVTEDQWYEAFRKVMTNYGDLSKSGYTKATIRFIDTAGDKVEKAGGVARNNEEREEYEGPIRERQMGALLRLRDDLSKPHDGGRTYEGMLDVMMPMVSSNGHLKSIQNKIDTVAQERGLDSIHIGSMVEIPSYVYELDKSEAKFVSIGSNDLSSFMQAQNRYEGNSDLLNPAFLTAMEQTVKGADAAGIPSSICGDMASDPKMVPVLLGLGLRNLSTQVIIAPQVKTIVSRVDTDEAYELVQEIKQADTPEERMAVLSRFNEERLGLAVGKPLSMDWTPPKGPYHPSPSND